MSFQAMTWAVAQTTEKPLEKFVLIMLANYANDERQCWPSAKRIARDTGMSCDTVRRSYKALAEQGLIELEPRHKDGVQLPHRVTLRCEQGVYADSEGGTRPQRQGYSPTAQTVYADSITEPVIKPVNEPVNDTRPRSREVVGFSSFELQEPFSRFWTAYGKRCAGHNMVARPHCLAKFSAIVSTGVHPEALISAAEAGNGTNPDTRYTQKPLNWLCDAGWEAKPPIAASDGPSANVAPWEREKQKNLEAWRKVGLFGGGANV